MREFHEAHIDVGALNGRSITPCEILDLVARKALDTDVWRVADDCVESGVFAGEDLGEFLFPVEGVDFLVEVIVGSSLFIVFEEVGGDKGVAALDVGGEVGQCAFVEEAVLVFEGLGVLAFEDL